MAESSDDDLVVVVEPQSPVECPEPPEVNIICNVQKHASVSKTDTMIYDCSLYTYYTMDSNRRQSTYVRYDAK